MTQSKNASLIQLTEVFPSWSQDDLLAVLNEAGGDVYVAISRISEGHVSQWSDSSKKTAAVTATLSTFETRPIRNERKTDRNRDNRNNVNNKQNDRSQSSPASRENRPVATNVNRKSSVPKTSSTTRSSYTTPKASTNNQKSASWGDSEETLPATMVCAAPMTEHKTSFAEAAASALAEKPKKQAKKKEDIPVVENVAVESSSGKDNEEMPKYESFESTPVKSGESESVSAVAVPEIVVVETVKEIETAIEVSPVPVNELILEEEEIVSMPSHATPSLTMEQPAVVLPVRTNLRTNLNVRFGYDASAEEMEKPVPVEEVSVLQPVKTPITVSALESTFAMLSTTSPAPIAKSPEPILSSPAPETSAWDNSRNSPAAVAPSSSSGYGNFSRNRQHGGWDYEPTASAVASNVTSSGSQSASFGPAPGFSGPTSPSAPQRFVSRAAAQYEHPSVYSPTAVPVTGNNMNNSRFSPYEESSPASNNVSQYYTNRSGPQSSAGYPPVYRGNNNNNSFNSSRYSSPNRPYYQQHVHHQQVPPTTQQQTASSGHYSPYNTNQNYLNNYHHGYPQYHQHADQYSNPSQPHQQQPQQPYYQPYQPPNQYLSNSSMHHHGHHHHQNHHEHHNA